MMIWIENTIDDNLEISYDEYFMSFLKSNMKRKRYYIYFTI